MHPFNLLMNLIATHCDWSEMANADFVLVCFIERELLLIKILRYGNMHFWAFLLLWPWSWPDDLHIWTWPVFARDTLDVQIWTSYVEAVESNRLMDRQTYRQTESTKIIKQPIRVLKKRIFHFFYRMDIFSYVGTTLLFLQWCAKNENENLSVDVIAAL